ncbi:MAG: glutamate-5-semialdehyde dehydrogenase [Pelagibacteraceae bacterium]|jgi:glutamate-5-semialdehyde dehydrogenase|nr:glutamate-5-semialdehyde dehydrogenase [Pelagibacteraceae bacterium]MBO6481349.1 glutamate-5-semialdehyde dehydrogenase [Pelagibacteraceae bacterium]MBO6483766.1 glutamate-5-semialdehyde dehydrogenase [Pelagibacteraceae bacterium]MBO6484367.1 glutamate-5-semialdehyde dehydrogenase [Pelagibacteraceae bacterium]MBO6486859.1 glutamate-5-semialdehyde dehydrogenase [Pelagibacteraceae bacterium]|tara:strand:+ start:132 stop:1376 length:1245 start_codon:yes stop_codon:yes gene_type:complete
MNKYLKNIGLKSRLAFKNLNKIKSDRKNKVLETYIKELANNKKEIIKENIKDIKSCKRKDLIDRLIINDRKIEDIRNSISQIIKFKDPLGKVLAKWRRPNNLLIKKVTIPIGVIGVIYESRPNVTSDVSSLCLKSGNVAILRGGSESFHSNKILSNLFRNSLIRNKIDKNCIQFIDKKNRKIVDGLLSKMSNYIDVIVPRGGKNLVRKVKKFSTVNVIGHLDGNCHVYIDKDAKLEMAKKVVLNSKMRRTSICGAAETLLIDTKCMKSHAVPIIKELIFLGCEVVVDKKLNQLFQNKLKLAKEVDWRTEYLKAKISIKTVKGVEDAVAHILKYGTMHTDAIITNNKKTAKLFLNGVNSAIAIHNASTQFADGGEFGFGGEIGISTNKLPPRGPVGINQLTSYKYIVEGKGSVRS